MSSFTQITPTRQNFPSSCGSKKATMCSFQQSIASKQVRVKDVSHRAVFYEMHHGKHEMQLSCNPLEVASHKSDSISFNKTLSRNKMWKKLPNCDILVM